VIWAVSVLMIWLAAAGAWAWYFSRRQLAVTSQAGQRRLLRQGALASAGVSAAILILGVAAFALTGHNWLVLAAIWPYGLLRIGLLVTALRRAHKRTDRTGLPR
jgi:hypothetical protein